MYMINFINIYEAVRLRKLWAGANRYMGVNWSTTARLYLGDLIKAICGRYLGKFSVLPEGNFKI